MFAMQIDVCLPSGKSCSVSLPPDSSVRELRAKAQQQLKHSLRLVFRGQELHPLCTLNEVGVHDGDSIDAIVH